MATTFERVNKARKRRTVNEDETAALGAEYPVSVGWGLEWIVGLAAEDVRTVESVGETENVGTGFDARVSRSRSEEPCGKR